MEQDLEKQLQTINQSLVDIKNKKNSGIWRSFFNGMFSALGYVAGLAVVILILGWVLNKTGVFPAFKQQVSDIQQLIDQAKKLNLPEKQGSGTTLILPNGQEVKVK